jgi:putative SOS response-associated peptidase YedK
VPGPHNVYGFLTTSPNAVVEPIHPKAMLVILTTDEEQSQTNKHLPETLSVGHWRHLCIPYE